MKKVAVIILNWNGEKLLREFLPSVIATTDSTIADVIVADNGSTDSSVELLRNEFPQVKVLEFSENYGFAEGYNRAIKETNYPYTILLNSDVATTDGWVNPLYEQMEANPNIGACQPKIRAYTNKSHFEYAGAAGGFIDCNGYPYCRGRIFDSVEEDKGQYDDIIPIFWATGAALMVRSELYLKVGGLDKDFFAHMEEIDLCWRLRTMGRAIVCIAESTAYHLGGATLNQGNPRKTFLNFRNNLLMLYKNLPEDELKSVMRMRWWLDMLAAMQFLAKFDFANFKAVLRANREFRRMKPDFEADRQLNLSRRKIKGRVPERCDFSILWQYYAKGKKTYQEL